VSVKKTIIGAQPFGAFKAAIDPLLGPAATAVVPTAVGPSEQKMASGKMQSPKVSENGGSR
jgi:hypothetical protein